MVGVGGRRAFTLREYEQLFDNKRLQDDFECNVQPKKTGFIFIWLEIPTKIYTFIQKRRSISLFGETYSALNVQH